MGDKSPKAKEKAKKQGSAEKKQNKMAADKKGAALPQGAAKKGK